jgi:hypothetical protein
MARCTKRRSLLLAPCQQLTPYFNPEIHLGIGIPLLLARFVGLEKPALRLFGLSLWSEKQLFTCRPGLRIEAQARAS